MVIGGAMILWASCSAAVMPMGGSPSLPQVRPHTHLYIYLPRALFLHDRSGVPILRPKLSFLLCSLQSLVSY